MFLSFSTKSTIGELGNNHLTCAINIGCTVVIINHQEKKKKDQKK